MYINAKADMGDGVFLVRRNANNLFVLSVMTGTNFYNYAISLHQDKGKYYYMDDGPYFRTLEHMIEYHYKYEDGLRTKLISPVSPNSKYSQLFQNELLYANQTRKTSLIHINSADATQKPIDVQLSMKDAQSTKKESKKKNKLKPINECDIKLEAIIGEGKFGTVYKGTYEGAKQVAIKILKDYHATGDFKREVEIMEKLGNHPCIVRVFVNKVKFMMVQELMMGSLLDKLHETPRVITEYNLKSW